MFSPEYFRQTSLLNGKENLMGNLEAAGLIENMAFECIKNNIGLYAAQEQIKTILIDKYVADLPNLITSPFVKSKLHKVKHISIAGVLL